MTPSQRGQIRRRYAFGYSVAAIAKETGRTVAEIKTVIGSPKIRRLIPTRPPRDPKHYHRARRQLLKATKICVDCSMAKATSGKTTCDDCRLRRRAKDQRYRQRLRLSKVDETARI